jgi:hypothetical protein
MPHLLRQPAAGPFGVADQTARGLVNAATREPRALRSTHAFVTTIRHAYERLPAAARGPAVTAAFAWAKAYVSSPAFASMYAGVRQQARPAGTQYDMSVDEELQKKLDSERASLEESKKNIGMLPEADRARVLAAFKEAEDRLRDPEMIKAMREQITTRRDEDQHGTAEGTAQWNVRYPANPRDFVKRELEHFLEASASIDFTPPLTIVKSPAGAILGFVAPTGRPLQWIEIECLLAGKEMVMAGRAAAETWVKELAQ